MRARMVLSARGACAQPARASPRVRAARALSVGRVDDASPADDGAAPEHGDRTLARRDQQQARMLVDREIIHLPSRAARGRGACGRASEAMHAQLRVPVWPLSRGY